MKFKCYRNKAIAVESPVVHSELIIYEPEHETEIETTSDTTEEVSTSSRPELNEDVAELPKEEATTSTIN